MKRRIGLLLASGALLALGGCVYTPGYYTRPGVVYDDGTADYAPAVGYGYGYGYYAPGYYYSDPWCCYGGLWPWIGFNYHGGYYHGGHWRGGHGWHDGGPRSAPRPLPGSQAAPRGSYSHGH
ncbi:MAG TPA: hypothetical protein VIC31_10165 [Rudaea sp.]|jgi:hypothetical protein